MPGETSTTGGQSDAGTTVLTSSAATTATETTATETTTATTTGADTTTTDADTASQTSDDAGKEGDAVKPGETTEEPAGAPAEYAAFELPDGFAADGPVMDEFKAAAKELKLPQGEAQKLASLGAKLVQQTLDQQREAWTAQTAAWVETVKTDPEIGGAQMPERVAVAVKALDRFGTPELKEALNTTGMGNHPEVIRFMHRVGLAIGEDTLVTGAGGGGGDAVSTEDYYAGILKQTK